MWEPLTASAPRLRRLLTWDEALLVWVSRLHMPHLTPLMLGLTRSGDTESWFLYGIFLFVIGFQLEAVLLVAGGLGATLPVQILKRVLRRRRPTRRILGFSALEPDPDAFSFPSGHTATAFGVALSFLLAESAFAGPAFGLASGIALSRVYLGAHYPIDVGVGAVLGTFGAFVSWMILGG